MEEHGWVGRSTADKREKASKSHGVLEDKEEALLERLRAASGPLGELI